MLLNIEMAIAMATTGWYRYHSQEYKFIEAQAEEVDMQNVGRRIMSAEKIGWSKQ